MMNHHRKCIKLLSSLIVAFYSYIAQATNVNVRGILIDSIGKSEELWEEENSQINEEDQKSCDAGSLVSIIQKGRNHSIKICDVKFGKKNANLAPTTVEENSDLELDYSYHSLEKIPKKRRTNLMNRKS